MQKRILSIILALSLMFSLAAVCGITASAESFTSGDFEYEILDDDTVEITKYYGSAETLKIPNEIDGKTVTSIGNYAFAWCDSLTSVTIPDSVTTIGDSAFEDCDSLTSVTIPDSVTTIGDSAFAWCDSLTSVTIGNSVTTIGYKAFAWCASLTNVDVSVDNQNYSSQNGVLFNKDKTMLMQYPIGKEDIEYTIPDSVTTIGEQAFYDCKSLTSVTIPSSVTRIAEYCFNGCSKLTEVNLGDDFNCSIGVSAGTYTADVMVAMFNQLKDLTGVTAKTLTLGSTNLAKLTDEQKAIATNKNWNLA